MRNVTYIKSAADWQHLEASGKPVLVDFWAEWCGPCHMLEPIFVKLASNYGQEINFAKVNVDELPELAERFGIRSIPTLLLLRAGSVQERLVGMRPYDAVARVLNSYVQATVSQQ